MAARTSPRTRSVGGATKPTGRARTPTRLTRRRKRSQRRRQQQRHCSTRRHISRVYALVWLDGILHLPRAAIEIPLARAKGLQRNMQQRAPVLCCTALVRVRRGGASGVRACARNTELLMVMLRRVELCLATCCVLPLLQVLRRTAVSDGAPGTSMQRLVPCAPMLKIVPVEFVRLAAAITRAGASTHMLYDRRPPSSEEAASRWCRSPCPFGARAPKGAMSAHFVAAHQIRALPPSQRAKLDVPNVGCSRL
jgi:hypothetical protein